MPSNVEIKARAHDFPAMCERAAQLSARPAVVLVQTDTFFKTTQGRLKLRETVGAAAQLIFYERPDGNAPRRSDYEIFRTEEPASLKVILTKALGERGSIEKVRRLFLVGQTRVHLDEVRNLGNFVELEVVLQPGDTEEDGRRIAEKLMSQLEIRAEDLLQSAYIDLLEQAR